MSRAIPYMSRSKEQRILSTPSGLLWFDRRRSALVRVHVEPASLAGKCRCSGSAGRQHGLVATDEGVYSTRQIATCVNGPANCWSVFGTGLPFAPVVQLSASPATTLPNVLAAGTYGRGIWQIPLWTSGTQLTTASAQPSFIDLWLSDCWETSSAQAFTLTNTGGIALAVHRFPQPRTSAKPITA